MTTIYFFGGAQASQNDVNAWRASALKQKPDLAIAVYAWPHGANIYHPLEIWPKGRSELIARMMVHNGDPDSYIVGHSSGCAYANAVAEAVLNLKHPFHLVCLDGFAPDATLQALPTTQIWAAQWKGLKSLNYYALNTFKNFKVYEAIGPCQATWALHFSLVNKNSNDHTVGNVITKGYTNCNSNLTFLSQ